MENPSAYLPSDRRRALAKGESLPAEAEGAVLFADISGFTPLTEALAALYGPRRGADELTRHLNEVYGALIAQVHRFGGSVIGFSGDAITCWFAGGQTPGCLAAIAAALAMQQAMHAFAALSIGKEETVALAIKTAVAAGRVRRFVVGNPQIQLIDVLAGEPLAQMAAAEQHARQGELLLNAETAASIQSHLKGEWRSHDAERYFCVQALATQVDPVDDSEPIETLPADEVRSWLHPALYERMQGEQALYLAELRPATALFLAFDGIDYEGDPAAGEKLKAFICRVQQVVHGYEGSLIQLTTGDKGSYLYAAFGAPIAHDDDNQRAVAAALDLRTLPAEFEFIHDVRIGISQGRMRVGAYGSETRRTYGVLGDEVNLAARLMGRAAPGQILLSERVTTTITDAYEIEFLGTVQVKGKSEPLPVYTVAGERMRLDEQFTALYAHALVGRQNELAQMEQCLAQVKAGKGQVLRIIGVAGVGKSHLAAALLARGRADGVQVAIGSCQSTEQSTAYASVRQIARRLLGIDDKASPQLQIERVTTIVEEMNPEWLLLLPLLGDLLGLPIPDNATTAAFDSQLRQQALMTLAAEIVRTRARQRPLLILYEDVHWIDEASQRLLTALARQVADIPILLLLVHRPALGGDDTRLRELESLPQQTIIELNELSEAGVAELIRQRLGGDASPLLLSLVYTQGQGNPFFTEELIDALREGGDLVQDQDMWTLSPSMIEVMQQADCLTLGEDGQWRLASEISLASVNLGLTDSIHGLVLARLDRLPEPTKLTLKVASVVGRIFDFELLARVHPLGIDEPTLLAQLETLNRRDFARLERPRPQLAYIFKHNITQEVVYRTLLESQQQALHLAVANHLAQLQPGAVEQLAFHYRHSDLSQPETRQQAIYYLDAAGAKAKREYANETALRYYDRALALDTRWTWLAAKADILHILGRREEEQATLQQLHQMAGAPAFEVQCRWGEYYEAISNYPQALTSVQRALQAARRSHDLRGQVRALARLGMIDWRQGEYENASGHYAQALALLANQPEYADEEAEARYGLGLLYRQQGEYNAAAEQLQRVLELNQSLDDRQDEARTLMALGGIAFLRRRYEEALDFYRRALMLRRSIGDRSGEGASLLSLGQAVRSLGDYAEAEILLREALTIQQATGNRWWESIVWNELGVIYMMVGQYSRAEHGLQAALQISREIGDEAGIAYALCNLGQVQREQSRHEESMQTLLEGLEIARTQEDRHLEALYLSDLGLTQHSQGNHQDAIPFALRSLQIFRDLSLDVLATADLALLAAAYLALDNLDLARLYAEEALTLLDACRGEGPDYPQRDYFFCYQVMQAAGEPKKASHALAEAHRLLQQQAQKISHAAMQRSFLYNVAGNRTILSEWSARHPLLCQP